ncbi:hypothetical protein DPMN_018075 [Dreissena polymorpha]|uniref:Uncharacterized protein n=1 Tax=Dreissena polymorpha TaxID=45954 RepID=A0A9D4S819_DREPO|nr:hypothetical protein DPMN_018075 [Dreissena polymorpha]
MISVFVVLVNAPEFRTLMYRAVLLDMADGDYVFIAIQLAEIDWWGTYRKYHLGLYQSFVKFYKTSVNKVNITISIEKNRIIHYTCSMIAPFDRMSH